MGKIAVWTEEQDNYILKHYHAGTRTPRTKSDKPTCQEIATHLGKPVGSVITRYHTLVGSTHQAYKRKAKNPTYVPPVVRQVPSMPKLKFMGEK